MVTTIPAAHVRDKQPVHFRVIGFMRTPASPEPLTPSDEFMLTVEWFHNKRKENWGVSEQRRRMFEVAITDAIQTGAWHWVNMDPGKFPQNMSYIAIDRILEALRDHQIVKDESTLD